MRRWVWMEIDYGERVRCFAAKVEYPLLRSVEAAPRHGLLAVEFMMEAADGELIPFPADVPGCSGVSWVQRRRIISCSLLKEANIWWEAAWEKLQQGEKSGLPVQHKNGELFAKDTVD